MRVYYTRPLLSIVEGTEQIFQVIGRLGDGATVEMKDLEQLPSRIQRYLNEDYAGSDQTIGDVLGPTLRTPDVFEFSLEVGRLARLARECLIEMVPLFVENWETRHVPIRDLYLGGENEVLRRHDRARLESAIREVWKRPVRDKVFVLGDDLTGLSHVEQLRWGCAKWAPTYWRRLGRPVITLSLTARI